MSFSHFWPVNAGERRTKSRWRDSPTKDQKPNRPDEAQRIRDMGGFIIHGRIMGELAVSRAFGDIDFKVFDAAVRETQGGEHDTAGSGTAMLKGPLVSCTPEITTFDIREEDEFLVLGSDGLYDVFSDQEIVEYVRQNLMNGVDLQRAAEGLVDYAITTQGSRDNVTAILIALHDLSFLQG